MAKRDNGLNLQSSSLIMRIFIGAFVVFMGVFILGPLIWLGLQAFSTMDFSKLDTRWLDFNLVEARL